MLWSSLKPIEVRDDPGMNPCVKVLKIFSGVIITYMLQEVCSRQILHTMSTFRIRAL